MTKADEKKQAREALRQKKLGAALRDNLKRRRERMKSLGGRNKAGPVTE